MKELLFLLLMLTVSAHTFCQNNITYSYDSAGNRIKREIVLKTKSVSDPADSTNQTFYTDLLSKKEIRIYPNPTDGQLKIEVPGWENSDKGRIRIVNIAGQLIVSRILNSAYTELDISTKSNGVYILHIELNNQNSSWKIIKK